MKNRNRRYFLKLTAAGIAGTSLLPYLHFAGCSAPRGKHGFIGGLTSFSIINDVAALAAKGGVISADFLRLIRPDMNLGLPANIIFSGVLVKATNEQAKNIIHKAQSDISTLFAGLSDADRAAARQKRSAEPVKTVEVHERKIALMFGWAMAAGIREHLAPLYVHQKANGNLPSEMQIYHDMVILKEKAGLPGLSSASVEEIESLFNGMNPRMITRTHTLTPDYDDGQNWTLRITQWRKDVMSLNTKYAEALVRPDAAKMQRYITDENFYNGDNDILRLLNAPTITKDDVHDAIKQTGQSLYAQSVSQGIMALKNLTS